MNGAVNRDYDDILRRALHAAAESVEPSGDGLERIRERLGHPPLLSFSSIAGWYSVAAVRFTTWAVPAFGTACEIFWALIDRFRPLDTPPGHAKPGMRWLRPVTATALAIFVVAAGGFAALAIPHISGSLSASTGQNTPGGGAGGSQGQGAVKGSQPIGSGTPGSPGYNSRGPSQSSPAATKCHQLTGSASPTISPSPGSSNSSAPTSTSTSPGPTSTSPAPTTTSPSPTTSDTSPSEPSSGTTGTPGAEASSAAASTSPGATGSASPGSPSSSPTPLAPGGNRSAGRNQTAGPISSSSPAGPCPSVSPSKKATRKIVHTIGLGRSALVITSSGRTGRFVPPSGRSGY